MAALLVEVGAVAVVVGAPDDDDQRFRLMTSTRSD
jgi:hypothetical protein